MSSATRFFLCCPRFHTQESIHWQHSLSQVPKFRGEALGIVDGKPWDVCVSSVDSQATSTLALSFSLAEPLDWIPNLGFWVWCSESGTFAHDAFLCSLPKSLSALTLRCNVSLGQKWGTWRQEMWSRKSQCTVQFSAFWLVNYCVFSVLWHAVQFVHAASGPLCLDSSAF